MVADERFQTRVLKTGVWELGDFTLHSGARANNKLDLPKLLQDPEVRRLFLHRLGSLVRRYEPDLLWGVPTGGQQFAVELGQELGLPVAHLVKDEHRPGSFDYETGKDKWLTAQSCCLIGIEDVTTRLGSLANAIQVPEIGERTVAIAAGWRRGNPAEEHRLDIPVEWVIQVELPAMITPGHPFFQQLGHLAVGNLSTEP